MLSYQISKISLKNLPENPGIYQFKNSTGVVIYVGKAKSLKSRLSSYFGTNLIAKTKALMTEAKSVSVIKVNSEIEALLLEARLIRKLLPKYNIELRDDKSPLYIGLTREKYPRVLSLRKTQLQLYNLKFVYGPFTQSYATRRILRQIRRIFPYSQHKPGKRVCIYHQIGLCDPCPSQIEIESDASKKIALKRQFDNNLSHIRRFLRGDFTSLKRSLQKEMKIASMSQDFEKAATLREQIRSIDIVTMPNIAPTEYLKDPNLLQDIRQKETKDLFVILKSQIPNLKLPIRIECFDIAHLSGTNPTASMVTFVNGEPDKNYYRHFTIKGNSTLPAARRGRSDVDSMKEVLDRRAKHFTGWGRPDLIIVDGGKPQVSAGLEVIKDIPLVGLAKQFETIVVKTEKGFSEIRLPRGSAKNLVQRLRDEAHRFARRLHHKHVWAAMLK